MTINYSCWFQTARNFLVSLLAGTHTLCGTGSLVKLMFGKNPIYRNVKHGEEENYQSYFMEIINSVDLKNLTDQAYCRPFDAESACRDFTTVRRVANQAKKVDSLCPHIIEIMVMQYIYADPTLREKDKTGWIYKVMARSDQAYFPDAVNMYLTMYNC